MSIKNPFIILCIYLYQSFFDTYLNYTGFLPMVLNIQENTINQHLELLKT